MLGEGDAHTGFRDSEGIVVNALDTMPYADRYRQESNLVAAPITASYGKQIDSSDTNGGPPNLICANNFGERAVSTALSSKNQRLDADTKTFVVRAHGHAHYTEDESAGPVRSSGAKQSDVDLVISVTLNSGGNSGGFRTEPGEHLVTTFAANDYKTGQFEEHQQARPLTNSPDRSRAAPLVASFDPRNVTSNVNRTKVEYGASANTLHGGGLSIIKPQTVRRLTPTECERLQGYPDGHTAGECDSARYKMIGNAVTVNVVEWIARRVVTAFEDLTCVSE